MLTDAQQDFVRQNTAAAMTTLGRDGTPHSVRVNVGLVDGKLWSSSTADRSRTRNLRRDPRATLMIWEPGHRYLTVVTRANVIDDPDEVYDKSVVMYRAIAGSGPDDPLVRNGVVVTEDELRRTLREENRVLYELTPTRVYGNV